MKDSPFMATDTELEIHQESHLWAYENALVQKLLFMISPQGKTYRSSLASFLSYELKSLRHLNYFDTALLRDGALGLTKFFLTHREPHAFSTKLIVHEELAYLVPQTWRENVFYYKIQDTSKTPKSKLLLYGTLDKFSCPTKSLDSLLEHIQPAQYEEVYLLANLPVISTEESLLSFDNHYYELLQVLNQTLPKLKLINWNQAKQMDFSKFNLCTLNTNRFWIADSYIDHVARENGAHGLGPKSVEVKNVLETLRLSSHHHFIIHQEWTPRDEEHSKWLYRWYDAYETTVFKDEIHFPKETSDHKKTRLCTDELMSFVLRATEKYLE